MSNQNLNSFQQSRNRHAALTQYYRWFQIYERPMTPERIQNQSAIFSDDVVIESIFDTAKGVADYQQKLKAYEGSMNAHHVKTVDVSLIDSATLQLKATVLYQGIRNNKQTNGTIGYLASLSLRAHDLPVFTHLKLSHLGEAEMQPYQDAYTYNRAASLMHYWLFLIESEEKSASSFRELLSKDFELSLSTNNVINTWPQFEAWIDSINSRMKSSAHTERDFSVVDNQDGTMTMSVVFDWQGVTNDNQPMIATTRHHWVLQNDPNERFARIMTMLVEQVVPFQVLQPA